jgi:hypothetical protein
MTDELELCFLPLLSNHSRDHRGRCACFFFLNLGAHNEIIVISSAPSMVILERLSKTLGESMSSVAACFASVLSVKRTLSCKTEEKTLSMFPVVLASFCDAQLPRL